MKAKVIKSFPWVGILGCLLITSSCDSGPDQPATTQGSSFQVHVGRWYSVTETSPRATAHHEDHEYWVFKGADFLLRMAGRFDRQAQTGMQSSVGLIRNNLLLQFKHPETGQAISCHAAERPSGEIMRAIESEQRSAGHFKLSFTRCRDQHSQQAVNDLTLPVEVRGDFQGIPAR